MSADAPGWAHHTINDGVRADGSAATFDVLVRRVPRLAAACAGATSVRVAAGPATPTREADGHDSRGMSCSSDPQEPRKDAAKRAGSQNPMGHPGLRPRDPAISSPSPGSVAGAVSVPATAPALAFGDLASVKAMGTGRAAIVVGFDTEFTTTDGVRVIDSYQLSVPDQLDPAVMVHVRLPCTEPLECDRPHHYGRTHRDTE